MKWRRITGVLLITALIIASILHMIRIIRYYQPATFQPPYALQDKHADDTIRVLFMGDSWAAYHQEYDSLLVEMITIRTNKPCKVSSVGYVGAKSKEIYKQLFTGTKRYLLDHPDYCIISAGINDAVAKMSPDYYAINYSHIIRFLLEEGITPVIVGVPDVDYQLVYEQENIISKLRHNISFMVCRDDGRDDGFFSFQPYRIALSDIIMQSEADSSILYLNPEKWAIDDHHSKLYRTDGIHLNARGYQKLDSCLSAEIAKGKFVDHHGNDTLKIKLRDSLGEFKEY